ncbi:MAG: class A beta-lactamase, partial [Methanococcaceae archaeon]
TYISAIILLLLCVNAAVAQNLEKKLRAIASESRSRIGVGLSVIETNKSVWLNPETHFPMQSVYKLPIGMAVLASVDAGEFRLDKIVTVKETELIGHGQHSPIRDRHPEGNFRITIRELLQFAVSESDGTASDVLMRVIGGPNKVMTFLSKIGVNDIHIVNTELEIGLDNNIQYQNWVTPKSAIVILNSLYNSKSLKPESRELLLKLMTETETGLNRIKGFLPKGTIVAHKTGTSRTVEGKTAATNDIGIVNLPNGQHLLVAVFVSDSYENEIMRENVIAKIAKLGWDFWVK